MYHVVCETAPGTYVERFVNELLLDKDGVEHPRSILDTMSTPELAALGLHRVAHPTVSAANVVATGYHFEAGPEGAPICVLATRPPEQAELKHVSAQMRGMMEQHTELKFEGRTFSAGWAEIARLQVYLETNQTQRVRDMSGNFVDLTPDKLSALRTKMIHRVQDATAVEAAVNKAIDDGELTDFEAVRRAYHMAFTGTYIG